MNKLWRPTLTTKEATAICGSLSNPSKMPGHGYALPAYRCRIGSLLQLIPKAICHYCYALRGRYLFPRVKGGDGETVLQPVRPALGRCDKYAYLPLR